MPNNKPQRSMPKIPQMDVMMISHTMKKVVWNKS